MERMVTNLPSSSSYWTVPVTEAPVTRYILYWDASCSNLRTDSRRYRYVPREAKDGDTVIDPPRNNNIQREVRLKCRKDVTPRSIDCKSETSKIEQLRHRYCDYVACRILPSATLGCWPVYRSLWLGGEKRNWTQHPLTGPVSVPAPLSLDHIESTVRGGLAVDRGSDDQRGSSRALQG